MPAYTLLMDQLGQHRAKSWALRKLTTIGEACRAVPCEPLRSTIAWGIEQVTDNSQSYDHIVKRKAVPNLNLQNFSRYLEIILMGGTVIAIPLSESAHPPTEITKTSLRCLEATTCPTPFAFAAAKHRQAG